MPKINRTGQAKILTYEESDAILNDGGLPRLSGGVLATCLFTGCRIGEAVQLRHKDFTQSHIHFRRETTKGKHTARIVPLAPELIKYLPVIHATSYEFLFCGQVYGNHIHPRTVMTHLDACCDRLQIEGVSSHSFRRTALTRMHKAGVPLAAIQKISGHKTLASLQRYLEVDEQDLVEAIAQIGEKLCLQ